MVRRIDWIINKISRNFRSRPFHRSKYRAEIEFWKNELMLYEKWYDGEISLYNEPPPTVNEKIIVSSHKDSAILTWAKIHQFSKYLEDLSLDRNAFKGFKVLDIGSGPIPSACIFDNCELFCLDPLIEDYLKIGFPLHYYDHVKFIKGYSEDMPFEDHYFDAIISVNAIDHVDDFFKTAKEIERVLKPQGFMRMHIHYHKKTSAEPQELNDDIVKEAFKWCSEWHKLSESSKKHGYSLNNTEELFTLWTNFNSIRN